MSRQNEKMAGMYKLHDDIIQNILSRLPATTFASAACASKDWNKVCSRILSSPRLVTALSLNPSFLAAVREVLDKVLSEPIRPQFAIACVGREFCLEATYQLIAQKLGFGIPIIISAASGLIGIDHLTSEAREVKWGMDPNIQGESSQGNSNQGIVLAVGFFPDLKVDIIPLLQPLGAPKVTMVEKFVTDIMDYTASVSGRRTPVGIMLFGDGRIDMKPIMAQIDCTLPEETFVVGDASGRFFSRTRDVYASGRFRGVSFYFDAAVALVFARDRFKPHDVGETQFHVTLSTGIMPFGPQNQVVSVISGKQRSWLTARIEGSNNIIGGQNFLDDINEVLCTEVTPDLFMQVTQRRRYSISNSLMLRSGPSNAFYKILRGRNEYFVVDGVGIEPGDSFCFFHSDNDEASSSWGNAFLKMADLNRDVFGGFVFCCCHRSEPFFGLRHVDTFPFSGNFPGVPLAGIYCNSGIGRSSNIAESTCRTCLHVYSNVYLVMSYAPAALRSN